MIPFNKLYLCGKETVYIAKVLASGKISSDGVFTEKCQSFLEKKYGFGKCLLTTSCTDALEMAALLLDIKEGDEVIAPSYTFVSTVNAFVLRGAKIVFVDSHEGNPGMDEDQIESLITSRTKVIIPVHYAGIACDMDKIMSIANKHRLFVVEDCAQAIDSFYKGKALGSFGHFAAFSFHETKNITSGEGGMLAINDATYYKRAEIIREKGTNRSAFLRGEKSHYEWVDVGSSFAPSDILAAFLFAQLEIVNSVQEKRKEIWTWYYEDMKPLRQDFGVGIPEIPNYATNNGHMFYLICKNKEERTLLIGHLRDQGISAVFHYQSLCKSPYYSSGKAPKNMPNADWFTDCLLRLPFYFELSREDVSKITNAVLSFYANNRMAL